MLETFAKPRLNGTSSSNYSVKYKSINNEPTYPENSKRVNIPQGPSSEDNRKAITAVNSDRLMLIRRPFGYTGGPYNESTSSYGRVLKDIDLKQTGITIGIGSGCHVSVT